MAYSEKDKEKAFLAVLKYIEDGKPLRRALKMDNTPCPKTFYEWIDEDNNKMKQYVRACEMRADNIFEEMLDISDNTKQGKTIKTLSDGKKETTAGDMTQHRRLQIDTRKWMLAKMNPKKYGDKTTTLHGLEEGEDITELNINIKKAGK